MVAGGQIGAAIYYCCLSHVNRKSHCCNCGLVAVDFMHTVFHIVVGLWEGQFPSSGIRYVYLTSTKDY